VTIDLVRREIHMSTINFDWTLGLAMVLTYAVGRFNTPNTNRSSTTVARFWFALLSYCVGVFFLYLLLAGVVTNSPDIVKALGIGGEAVTDEISHASGPLLAALILTVLLPNFPVISRIDQGLLKFFQDMGNIPLEVRLLSTQLRKAEIEIPAAVQRDAQSYVKSKLEPAGLGADYLCFTKCDTPQYDWTRIVAMMTVLRSWEGKRRYAAMLGAFADDYKQVNDKFERLNVAAARCFPIFLTGAPAAKKPAAGGNARLPNPIAECRRAFQHQCEDLFNDIANLLARGILKCEFTRRERDARLAEAGFVELDTAVGGVDPNKIVAAIAMVFVILVTGVLLASRLLGESTFDIRRILTMSVMVAVIYGGAIVCALLPKSTWGFANRSKVGGRPYAGYAATSALTAVTAAAVSVAFKSIIFQDFRGAAMDLQWTYPWLGLSAVASAVLAYLADDYRTGERAAPAWARWAEGAAAGLILTATSVLVHDLLAAIALDEGYPRDRPVPSLPMVMAVTAAIGFALGATIPHWYRASTGKKAAEAPPVQLPQPEAAW
jgi:hypothetical protein